ncbi:MAG: hypothetical protein ACRENG_35565, partial [bacterium]
AFFASKRAARENTPYLACCCSLLFAARSLQKRQFQYIRIQPKVKHEMISHISTAKNMPDKLGLIATSEKDACFLNFLYYIRNVYQKFLI